MASSSSNNNTSNASSSAATGRLQWTLEQYHQVRILSWECVKVRQLITKHEVPDIFVDLNPGAKRFPVSDLADHCTKNKDTSQAKIMHEAWRTCGWKGVPYIQADKDLMERIRKDIRNTPTYRKYRADVKAKTGDLGEDVGQLEGSDAEWEREHGDDESD